jgi:hypothetical protein
MLRSFAYLASALLSFVLVATYGVYLLLAINSEILSQVDQNHVWECTVCYPMSESPIKGGGSSSDSGNQDPISTAITSRLNTCSLVDWTGSSIHPSMGISWPPSAPDIVQARQPCQEI